MRANTVFYFFHMRHSQVVGFLATGDLEKFGENQPYKTYYGIFPAVTISRVPSLLSPTVAVVTF
jgi:hypothetical protein